ncbi:MAG: hypothetical protein H8E60_01455 [Candidatus Marinimicrobia bacterium]|nr:hypothetical protein [Candidatus Neomarinimicrobiota bacterium]
MRIILLLTFLSSSFCQSFIIPQRPIFNLLKWEEINSSHILFQKVGPLVNSTLSLSEIASFYYSDSKSKGILDGEIFPEISINNSDGSRIRIYGSAGITLSESLTIQNEFEFDNKGEYDPHFQGVERGLKNGWVGYLQHSSLTYHYSKGHFSFGRGNPYFFNMNESLLLNPNFTSAEYLWWEHEAEWLQFDWGLLMLNQEESLNRFITFHRYGINNNNWRLGFTEAVLGSYENWGADETGYIMPASFLIETEENRGINANLMWLLDGMYKWKKWTFYGEFLIDDIALDRKSPPQIAGSAGIGRKFDKLLLNLEYTRINRWTGNYCDPFKRWIERDVPIGHSIGSDAHNLLINSYFPFNENLAVELSFNWMEDGSGTALERLIDWPDDVPCETNFGYNSESFPSASNTTSSGDTKFYYLIKDWLLAEFQISVNKKMPPLIKATFSFQIN